MIWIIFALAIAVIGLIIYWYINIKKICRLKREIKDLNLEISKLKSWQDVKRVTIVPKECKIDTISAEAKLAICDIHNKGDVMYEFVAGSIACQLAEKLKDYIRLKEVVDPIADPLYKILRGELKVIRPEEEKDD